MVRLRAADGNFNGSFSLARIPGVRASSKILGRKKSITSSFGLTKSTFSLCGWAGVKSRCFFLRSSCVLGIRSPCDGERNCRLRKLAGVSGIACIPRSTTSYDLRRWCRAGVAGPRQALTYCCFHWLLDGRTEPGRDRRDCAPTPQTPGSRALSSDQKSGGRWRVAGHPVPVHHLEGTCCRHCCQYTASSPSLALPVSGGTS